MSQLLWPSCKIGTNPWLLDVFSLLLEEEEEEQEVEGGRRGEAQERGGEGKVEEQEGEEEAEDEKDLPVPSIWQAQQGQHM